MTLYGERRTVTIEIGERYTPEARARKAWTLTLSMKQQVSRENKEGMDVVRGWVKRVQENNIQERCVEFKNILKR